MNYNRAEPCEPDNKSYVLFLLTGSINEMSYKFYFQVNYDRVEPRGPKICHYIRFSFTDMHVKMP